MPDGFSDPIKKIRSIADYQFWKGVGEMLFPDNVTLVFSKKTGRIRYVYLNGEMLATLRPSDGLFSLTISGAKRLFEIDGAKCLWVKVRDEAVYFVESGGNVFAKHVADVDEEIRPAEEVIVIDGKDRVIAVGRALLSGREMKSFKRGAAVNVRMGCMRKVKKENGKK